VFRNKKSRVQNRNDQGVLVIKTYSFRMGKGEEKISDLLGSMLPSQRSRFVKDAIMFYLNIGEEFKLLNARIERLAAGGLVPAQSVIATPLSDDIEDSLFAGINEMVAGNIKLD